VTGAPHAEPLHNLREYRNLAPWNLRDLAALVGAVLDASAIIDASYDLEVSSPGLDRLLRKERELCWAVGKRVSCWLAGGREVRGRLVAVEPDRLVLEHDGERVELPRAGVTKARLEAEVPWPRRA